MCEVRGAGMEGVIVFVCRSSLSSVYDTKVSLRPAFDRIGETECFYMPFLFTINNK